ncbi:MAG: hypothetical protein CMB80_09285 [Flammeovirgaceae bacterium]|nr:hypothetical protein [Flammeovirgaceae bacterium]
MSKPKYCPIINIGRTEPTTRCLRGECEFWDEGFEQCYVKRLQNLIGNTLINLIRQSEDISVALWEIVGQLKRS